MNTSNVLDREAVDKIGKITTEFEEKIQHIEAKLKTSKEDNDKAVKIQENMKKQLSEAIDQCNRYVQNLSVLSCIQYFEN